MDILSLREEEALQAIKDYLHDNGYPPTTRELGDMLGLSSSSTAYGYLERLEKKGYIMRTEATPRGIKIMEGRLYDK
jgi:repressor LexA